MDDLLTKLYYDPKTGYIGIQKLFAKAREIEPSIKLKDVKKRYSSQSDIQRFQEQKTRFDDFKISSDKPDSWQADLAFWGPKPVLTAVNINSRLGCQTPYQQASNDCVERHQSSGGSTHYQHYHNR
jgi:hypothetical protein